MKRIVFILMLLLLSMASSAQTRVTPSIPTLTSPKGLQSTHAPQFSWTGENALKYRLVILNSANTAVFRRWYSADVICSSGNCFVSPSLEDFGGLVLPNGAYTWRVIAKNGLEVAKSAWANFSIQYPGRAQLISPINDLSTGVSPAFEWSEVVQADQYQIIVTRVKTGVTISSGWKNTADVCFGASCFYNFGVALRRGAHTWSVVTRNSGVAGYKSKSKLGSFKVTP